MLAACPPCLPSLPAPRGHGGVRVAPAVPRCCCSGGLCRPGSRASRGRKNQLIQMMVLKNALSGAGGSKRAGCGRPCPKRQHRRGWEMTGLPGSHHTHHRSWTGSAPKAPSCWVLSTLPHPGAGPC